MNKVMLDKDETRLLSTYADGPRIWDATAIFAVVLRLAEKGMIAPVGAGDDGRYELTAAGRLRLAGSDMQEPR